VTGPATDLGIHLATAVYTHGKERWNALRGAFLRGGKIIAFAIGAGLSVPLTATLDYFALLAPASGIALATLLSFNVNAALTPSFSWSPRRQPQLVAEKQTHMD
jgi:hypothetical protein